MITEKVTSFIPDAIREAGNTIAAAIQGGSGGSSVEWSQIISTGTKIATITIDNESTDVYAPTGGGGSSVSWNEIQTTGTKIAEITIDGTTYDVYAPNVSVSASDVSYDNTTSGLIADDAQEAIDELAGDIVNLSGVVSGHTTDIGNLQTAVGSKTSQSMIAPVETSTTASQSYAIGEQFILNGVLYTATAAITAGGTITIDGNCTASDTVTEQIEKNHTQGKLLAEVVGNGTKTYAQLLEELETAVGNYDLTYTVLNLGGNIAQISNSSSKRYCAVEAGTSRMLITTTDLSAHTYVITQSAVGGSTTANNASSSVVPNGRKISIYTL